MGKRRSDGQPPGKTSSYAFFVKKCREEHKHLNPDDKIDFQQFSGKCAEKWRGMEVHQKKPFANLAKKDADRHAREMADWKKCNPQAAAAAGKSKKDKDPNMPKRALSAFFFFCGEKRASIKAEYPSLSVGDIAKKLGEQWRGMSEEEQKCYQDMHAKDKIRYDKQMAEYKKTGGGASTSKKAKKAPPPPKEVSEEEDDDDESEEEESEEESD